jgi:hypothetical protein
MWLVQILLPIHDNEGRPFPRELFTKTTNELAKQFGGLTAYTRSPAEGFWEEDGSATTKDEIIVFEVMATEIDRQWWQEYRRSLEARFGQDSVIVRAQQMEML